MLHDGGVSAPMSGRRCCQSHPQSLTQRTWRVRGQQSLGSPSHTDISSGWTVSHPLLVSWASLPTGPPNTIWPGAGWWVPNGWPDTGPSLLPLTSIKLARKHPPRGPSVATAQLRCRRSNPGPLEREQIPHPHLRHLYPRENSQVFRCGYQSGPALCTALVTAV